MRHLGTNHAKSNLFQSRKVPTEGRKSPCFQSTGAFLGDAFRKIDKFCYFGRFYRLRRPNLYGKAAFPAGLSGQELSAFSIHIICDLAAIWCLTCLAPLAARGRLRLLLRR